MLNTKEHFKQIEMDTIQQEPLFTELTPKAAATVEGGVLYTTIGVTSRLNIRSGPGTGFRIIGAFRPGAVFQASAWIVRDRFRLLLGRAGWVSDDFIRPFRRL